MSLTTIGLAGTTFGPIGISGTPSVTFGPVGITGTQSVTFGPVGISGIPGVTFGPVGISGIPGVTFGIVAATFPLVGITGIVAVSQGGSFTIAQGDKGSTGTITAVSQSVIGNTGGMSSVFVTVTGTWVGSLVFQIQAGDGVWVGTYGVLPFSTLLGNFVGNGSITIPVGGATQFRIFSNAWTSGTATITINAGAGNQAVQVHNLTPGNLNTTAAGDTASAAADSGNPVKVGAVFTTAQPTVTTGQRVNLQATSRGGLIVATGADTFTAKAQLQDNAGAAIVLGSATSANSVPVVIASNQGSFAVFADFSSRSDTFVVAGSGTTVNVQTKPMKNFSISVVQTGTVTSWDVRLEGSLDNVNFTQILQHTNVTGSGTTVFSGASVSPSLRFRARCAAIVLGTGTNIIATILGTT